MYLNHQITNFHSNSGKLEFTQDHLNTDKQSISIDTIGKLEKHNRKKLAINIVGMAETLAIFLGKSKL